MTIQEIETKYGFSFPLLYKQLDADGMLDVGEYGPNWYTEVYPTLKDNPPLLLHSYDFESLNLKSVAEEIEEVKTVFENHTEEKITFTETKIEEEFKFIEKNKSSYDIIFADPPYNLDQSTFEKLVELIFTNELLQEDGMMIIEHSKHTKLNHMENFSFDRNYGGSVFSFFEFEGSEEETIDEEGDDDEFDS